MESVLGLSFDFYPKSKSICLSHHHGCLINRTHFLFCIKLFHLGSLLLPKFLFVCFFKFVIIFSFDMLANDIMILSKRVTICKLLTK